jgi:lipopolysaccharide export system protein LptA
VATREAKGVKGFELRAKLPQIVRYAALGLLGVIVLIVIVGFYRGRNNTGFKLRSEHAQLSTDVTAEVNGYERLETDNGISKYYVKADYAKTFSDNHQELDNAYFEVYDAQGLLAEKMKAQKVLYIPEENKNFTAYMKGDVNIETADALHVKTNNIVYSKANETADADELVEFDRGVVRGKSFGATVKMGEKRLDLLKDVEIETFDSAENMAGGVRYSKINAGSASFDQNTWKIDLRDGVAIGIDSKGKSGNAVRTDVHAGRAGVFLAPGGTNDPAASTPSAELKKFELFDSVNIRTAEAGGTPTVIDSGYAIYDKAADRYELKESVHIVTAANDKTTDIRANDAVYAQGALKVTLSGNAEISQGTDHLSGSTIDTDLFADKTIRYAVIRGGGSVKQTTETRVTTITASELNAAYNDARVLQNANALGQSVVQIMPIGNAEYSVVTMTAPKAIHAIFKGEGAFEKMQTEGRTTIQLDAANKDSDAANKRVTADQVTTLFYDNGKDIRRAEAVGDAELYIEPLRAGENNYKTTVNAPRFDCDFFASGNNAKSCVGGKKTKTTRVPTIAKKDRGAQVMTADELTAIFSQQTKDVERFDASGSSKFTELDRTAIASQMSFTSADQTVRLRGGEPTAWDDRGRTTAREIDWDTKTQHSYLRGGVSTTYYSRQKAGDALPFSSSDKPVFATGNTAEFDHVNQVAVYTGNARGWQDNNFVRGDTLVIREKEGKLTAEGNVQSAIYNAKTRTKGKDASVPVFASSKVMNYDRDSRVIQYRENVDIRQGTDRLTSGSADVYLGDNNELSKTVAETGVVVTQPGRRASGNWIQYTASDEVAVLRGSPASITDSANGSSQAAELTFLMRENRVISEAKTKPAGSGRIRSTYKIDPKQ